MDDVIGLPARHKLDVHAYHRMAEAGIFRETDRIELIEGDLMDMAPIGLLVIEVDDSSVRFDRTVKLPLYARAGIVEYWIVDLKQRRLEAHRVPQGDDYAEVTTHSSGDTLALAAAPEIVVKLSLMFG